MITDTEMMGLDNELRATLGLEALHAAGHATLAYSQLQAQGWGDMAAATTAEDILVWIAHACAAVGLPPDQTFRDALRRYQQNVKGSTNSPSLGDGEQKTLDELFAELVA